MSHLFAEFCENRLSSFLRNPANKQTDADENITSFAEVIILSLQRRSNCVRGTLQKENNFRSMHGYARRSQCWWRHWYKRRLVRSLWVRGRLRRRSRLNEDTRPAGRCGRTTPDVLLRLLINMCMTYSPAGRWRQKQPSVHNIENILFTLQMAAQ